MSSARALAVAVALALGSACEPLHETAPAPALPIAVATPPTVAPAVTVAGTGSALPLVRRLVRAFAEAHPGPAVEVPDSIGTTGAVRAVVDHAIAVGLASRPLRPAERAEGVVAIPFARVAAVVAVHRDTAIANLDSAELVALFEGRVTRAGDGRALVLLSRERGDSGNATFAAVIPGLEAAIHDGLAHQRFRVLYHDGEMARALEGTPGGIGFLDAGAIAIDDLPLRALSLDGVEPTVENLRSGRYPYVKTLSFVLSGGVGALPARARELVAFALGPAGRQLAEQYGYLPPDGAPVPAADPERAVVPDAPPPP